MLLARFTVLLVLAASLVAQSDRRPDTSRLRVMSYNTEFMWDGRQPEEGNVSFPWKGSPDEADDHLQAIANTILLHDPDIILLCEVEGQAALDRLNTVYLPGQGYEVAFVQGADFSTGQDVAILTRITPTAVARDDSRAPVAGTSQTKGVSKNVYAKFDVGKTKIALVGLHFLAIPSSTSRRPQREAQAEVIRQRALTLRGEGYDVIVCGDFNDYDGAPESLDHQSSMPISSVLSSIRGQDPADPTDDLFNCCTLVPVGERFTSWWDRDNDESVDGGNEFTSIDHMLIAPALTGSVASVVFGNSGYDFQGVSDHCPVVLTLTTGSQPAQGLRIHSAVPNPAGDERQEELVYLVVEGGGTVGLTGWKLVDKANTEWDLSGDGQVGNQPVAIKRNGRSMALANKGDTFRLVNPQGTAVHTVSYPKVAEGERVYFR